MRAGTGRGSWRFVLLAAACLSAGAGVFMATRPAQAIIAILIGLRQGPVGLSRGTGGVVGLYVPANRTITSPVPTTVTIMDGTSNTILWRQSLSLVPGGACGWVRVFAMGDGSVRVNGQVLRTRVPEGGQLQIVVIAEARMTAGRLPKNPLAGTLQLQDLETGEVRSLLPFIEQQP